jgi:hypothetical protein
MLDLSLSREEIEQLKSIEVLVEEIKVTEDADDLIKTLASKHNIVKSYLSDLRLSNMPEKDVEYVKSVNVKVWNILEPIYNHLITMAREHMNQWYKRIKRESGAIDPALYDYQEDLANFLLEAIIKNELTDTIYTLVLSRGSG